MRLSVFAEIVPLFETTAVKVVEESFAEAQKLIPTRYSVKGCPKSEAVAYSRLYRTSISVQVVLFFAVATKMVSIQ